MRDQELRNNGRFPGFYNPWTDEVAQDLFFGYDVEEEVDRAWDAYLAGRSASRVPLLEPASLGSSLEGQVMA